MKIETEMVKETTSGDQYSKQYYDDVILNKIERKFDSVLPFGAVLCFVIGLIVYQSNTPIQYAFFDVTIGVILLALFFARKNISAKSKIMIVSIMVYILGITAVVDLGFSGTGFTLIILANIFAVAFFSALSSMIFSSVSIGSLLLVSLAVRLELIHYKGYGAFTQNSSVEWLIHIGVVLIIFIVLHTFFRGIKSYLIENIKELESSMNKTYDLAYYDQLTNLPNRYMFNDTLLKRAEVQNINGFLVLFNVKGLKLINSIYGNELGDEILAKIARIFEELKGDREMVARINGNEYAWWMEGLTEKALEYRLEYLKEQFYTRLRSLGISKKIEFYVCYAHFPSDGTSIEEVYRKSTMTLEYAKNIRNTSVLRYNEDLEKETREEELIRELLLSSIEKKSFEIAYQEKVDSRTGKVTGLEALARWYHNDRGYIPPSLFIPIVESSNLSVVFGNMIITKVLDEYPRLKGIYGEDVVLSINVSPSHMASKGFKVFLMEEISRRDFEPSKFMIEITEEIMIEGMEVITEVIRPLREFGIGISLDDFGTGYSSLNYLTMIELDELKIDKSFIDQLSVDSKTIGLLRAIISITDNYNMSIVAEGVETKEQSDLLKSLGCYKIQGYYYSKPTLLKDLLKSN